MVPDRAAARTTSSEISLKQIRCQKNEILSAMLPAPVLVPEPTSLRLPALAPEHPVLGEPRHARHAQGSRPTVASLHCERCDRHWHINTGIELVQPMLKGLSLEMDALSLSCSPATLEGRETG